MTNEGCTFLEPAARFLALAVFALLAIFALLALALALSLALVITGTLGADSCILTH